MALPGIWNLGNLGRGILTTVSHLEQSGGCMSKTVTARELAAVLHESQVQMIARALKVLGPKRCITFLTEALLCEHQGGMLTKEGIRRSMGGIFLQLCREQATREERKRIFG